MSKLAHAGASSTLPPGPAAAIAIRTASAIEPAVRTAASMAEAVRLAMAAAAPGGSVLLAPACASFDMFENYAARGRAFKAEVDALRRDGR